MAPEWARAIRTAARQALILGAKERLARASRARPRQRTGQLKFDEGTCHGAMGKVGPCFVVWQKRGVWFG